MYIGNCWYCSSRYMPMWLCEHNWRYCNLFETYMHIVPDDIFLWCHQSFDRSITTRTDQANRTQDTKHILPDALTISNINFNLKLPHAFLCKEDVYILVELEDNQLTHLLWYFVIYRFFLKVQVLITAACTCGVWILAYLSSETDRIVLAVWWPASPRSTPAYLPWRFP